MTVSILLGGFYIRIFEIPFAILRYVSFLSYPRFTLQGLAINEMKDDVYKPQGCLSASLLGATKAEIDNLINNDTQGPSRPGTRRSARSSPTAAARWTTGTSR